ncbi:MAG: IS1-like element transposase [Candidatus Symbiodolus clandestinus]
MKETRLIRLKSLVKGVQRYRCKSCSKHFQLEYRYNGNQPGVADKVVDMALNGSGVRDTSGVLKVSQNTVIRRLKKISASPSD